MKFYILAGMRFRVQPVGLSPEKTRCWQEGAHAFVHASALAHLLGFETTVFSHVFSIAANNYTLCSTQAIPHCVPQNVYDAYIEGTGIDILTHILHFFALLNV